MQREMPESHTFPLPPNAYLYSISHKKINHILLRVISSIITRKTSLLTPVICLWDLWVICGFFARLSTYIFRDWVWNARPGVGGWFLIKLLWEVCGCEMPFGGVLAVYLFTLYLISRTHLIFMVVVIVTFDRYNFLLYEFFVVTGYVSNESRTLYMWSKPYVKQPMYKISV